MLRTAIPIVTGLATAAWLWVLVIAILTNLGSKDNWITIFLAMMSSAPILVLTLPAFILALKRKFLGLALVLALLSLISVVLIA